MGQIIIHGQVALFDDEDTFLVESWKWHLHPSGRTIYLRGFPKGNRAFGLKYMHRLLTGAEKGEDVDHVNGDGLDNRRLNIRRCDRSQNSANRHAAQSATGVKGVHFEAYTGKWRAEIQWKGRRWKLGRFHTQGEAAKLGQQRAQLSQQKSISDAMIAAANDRAKLANDGANTRALAQRILDDAKLKQDALFKNADLKLKGADLGLKERELDIKEKQNPNLKLSAAQQADVGTGMDILGKIKALRAIPNKGRFLGTFSDALVGGAQFVRRLGANVDPQYLKDAQDFQGGTADITSAIAKETYGATRAGEEIKEAAASLLNTKMSVIGIQSVRDFYGRNLVSPGGDSRPAEINAASDSQRVES